MRAAFLQLKELAVLLCEQPATLPRRDLWKQFSTHVYHTLPEHEEPPSPACRLSTTSSRNSLFFTHNAAMLALIPNRKIRRSITRVLRHSLYVTTVKEVKHDRVSDGTSQPCPHLGHVLHPPLPEVRVRSRRSPRALLQLRPSHLARFTSDARHLAAANDSEDHNNERPVGDERSASEILVPENQDNVFKPDEIFVQDGQEEKSVSQADPPDGIGVHSPLDPPTSNPPRTDETDHLDISDDLSDTLNETSLKLTSPEAPDISAPDVIPDFYEIIRPHLVAPSQLPSNAPEELRVWLDEMREAANKDVRSRAHAQVNGPRPGQRADMVEHKYPRLAKDSASLWLVWDRAIRSPWKDAISIQHEFALAQCLLGNRPKEDTVDARNLRGSRLKQLLDHIEERAGASPELTQPGSTQLLFQSLRVYQFDLLDDWQSVQSSLRELLTPNAEPLDARTLDLRLVNLIRLILKDALQYDGPMRVLDLALDNFATVETPLLYWTDESARRVRRWGFQAYRVLETVEQAVATIKRPLEFLEDKERIWDQQRLRRAARLFLALQIRQREPELAYAVYLYQRRKELPIPWKLLSYLTRLLAKREAYAEAEDVFQRLVEVVNQTHGRYMDKIVSVARAGLGLAAHKGDVEAAELYFRRLEDIYREDHHRKPRPPNDPPRSIQTPDEREMTLLLHAYAVAGRLDDLLNVFARLFPSDNSKASQKPVKPNIFHYASIIMAYSRQGDLESTNRWLATMAGQGIQPNVYIYNIILHEFALRGDVDSVRSVLAQMSKARTRRDHVTYVHVIGMYGRLRDPVNAEKAFKHALKHGIRPSRQLFEQLVNVHVEAASWPGVIRVFDYVMNLPYRTLRLSISLCNILLKAYVVIGAPHYTVRGVFSRMTEFGATPNASTYSLVIQSAIDSGRMSEAKSLFLQMQSFLNLEPSSPVNVYPLSMLVAGHLRRGEHDAARAHYNEMIENDIQPSTKTFAAIIRSHATADNADGLRIAEDFLKQVLENPGTRTRYSQPRVPADTMQYLFVPLLLAHALKSSSSETERVYAEFLEQGGSSSISTLSILLLSYSRAGDIDAVVQVWEEVHKLGLSLVSHKSVFPDSPDTEDQEVGGSHASWLSYALSVYIDALSTAGKHNEIAETLASIRAEGFAFDANNWNHIAVAMMRAGEPEHAFEVLEKVILRYQGESERLMRERNMHPASPFIFDGPKDPEELERLDHRTSGAKERRIVVKTTERRVPFPGHDIKGEQQMQSVEDLIHSLHILHQVSPAWHLWKPFPYLLRVLGKFLTRDDEDDSVNLGLSAGGASDELMQRIYTTYPGAVAAVVSNQHKLDRKRSIPTVDRNV
ncbi:hypothetical protein DACRYDRAFT_113071 [Dacryopinax primogenitus]|uniref:Pentacotripeptide-repeat region of PRORP domain-containing protein n=1 Tax=Dacryopinax primogenitus (strain DJM 731) TaxID=1858805 RepID=M5GBK9_DACPD|nr:uncharacterized protein DACRYDRAFT_113071 [Dacryopinax primogenitus]EJU06354.1 hypothetical protein DACRYDRAFT_113071 [Dacryopinax primogenitus]